MILVKNNIIPFSGYKAINLFGIIFYKGNYPSKRVINHEAIHTAQMKELLYIFFYIWYGIEYFIRLFQHGDEYRSISFEREAYDNDDNLEYLKTRKKYAWFKYVNKSNI